MHPSRVKIGIGATKRSLGVAVRRFALAIAVASALFALGVAGSASAHELSWLRASRAADAVAERLAEREGWVGDGGYSSCRRVSPHRFACKLHYYGLDTSSFTYNSCDRKAAVFYPNRTTKRLRIALSSGFTCRYTH